MNLERHFAVLWKHRGIIIGGVVVGLITALLAAYQPTSSGLERRGIEEWSSDSTLLVTQKGFPWGRVTLPAAPIPGTAVTPQARELEEALREQGGGIPYADPTRLSGLALVYAVMSNSDRVRANAPGRPVPGQVTAVPLDPTGQGDQDVPILQITATSTSASGALELNRQTVAGLGRTLLQEQRRNSIPEKDRVQLDVLRAPAAATLVAGRSWVSPILALLLCIGGAVALAHLREAMVSGGKRSDGLEGLAAEEFNLERDLELWNGASPWDRAGEDRADELTAQLRKGPSRLGDG